MMKKLLFLLTLIGFVLTVSSQSIAKWKIEDVVKSYSANNDTTYVVNFWATFCKPCIEEIPDFTRLAEKYKDQKVKLLLVSLDLPSYYPAKIAAFVKRNPKVFRGNTNHVWLNETNADHFCPMIDEKWSGAIPSTIIVNNKTGYRKFVEDQMNAAEFEASLKEAIGGNATMKFAAPMNNAVVIDKEATALENYTADFVIFKSEDSTVYAVAAGKVASVAHIENFKVLIVEQDGLFFTYSNLGSSNLKKGDMVTKDQFIGYAATSLNGSLPTLDFYLNNAAKSIELTKANFTVRKDKRLKDHSIDRIGLPQ